MVLLRSFEAPGSEARRMNWQQQRRQVGLRRLSSQSPQGDFVRLLPWFEPLGNRG